MPKFKVVLFLALVCLGSCQKQKEAAVADVQDFDEGASGEQVLADRTRSVNSSRKDDELDNGEGASGEQILVDKIRSFDASLRDSLNDTDITNKNFENVIWWDANWRMGSGYHKRILFYNGNFIVHDMNWDKGVAYGQYVVDDDGRIICSILNRHIFVENTDASDEYYNLFFDYYKLFLENDTIIFTVKHDPNLYYMQWQLTSDPGGELYKAEDEYTKADMIYYNDGIKLYKYSGGIKQCADRLNVREKPSLDARVIRVLETGEHVAIEARTTAKEKIDNTEDYWYYVNHAVDDQYIAAYGYVFGAYLTGDGSVWTPP
jgi:hypothetical protein